MRSLRILSLFLSGILVVCLTARAQEPVIDSQYEAEFSDIANPYDMIDCCDGGCCDTGSVFDQTTTTDGCCCGEQFTGDWLGVRSSLAESGITFQGSVSQFYMGVVDGGLDHGARYSGHGDYLMNIDSSKLGGPQGLFVKIRAEHRFNDSLAGATGALLPSNIAADLPVVDSDHLYLTNVLFTQMFSESFGVFAGKLDTFDGDVNAFAHGRGIRQFSNMAFVVNPAMIRTVPYSTLGAGFVILNEGEPILTFSVLNPTDTTRTSGFDELFEEGVVLSPELRLPTQFFGLPGHQLFGGTWSSREYGALDQDPRIILPNVPIARQTGSWSLYWNFDQYLCVDEKNPTQGWGTFGRAAITDDDTNPIAWFLSFGVGGNSIIPHREADTFGAGWYYSRTSTEIAPFIDFLIGGLGDGQGVELFYNIAVTKAFHLTADVQLLKSARKTVDDAMVLGLRAVVDL